MKRMLIMIMSAVSGRRGGSPVFLQLLSSFKCWLDWKIMNNNNSKGNNYMNNNDCSVVKEEKTDWLKERVREEERRA